MHPSHMPNATQGGNLHAPRPFRWRALATLAGRQPIGGDREIALGCLMAARLAAGGIGESPMPAAVRGERSVAARAWLASLTVPPPIRAALLRVAEASGREDAAELASAVRALAAVATAHLDASSRMELERLAQEVQGPA
jgi:hypothetical protein